MLTPEDMQDSKKSFFLGYSMYQCYICEASTQGIMDYFCETCQRVRRYIMNFGSKEVLQSIESYYLKDGVVARAEKPKPQEPQEQEAPRKKKS